MQKRNQDYQLAYAFASVGFNGIYCGFGLRSAFERPEIIGLVAAAVACMFLFGASIHSMEKRQTIKESLISFKNELTRGTMGMQNAFLTACLTILSLCIAIQLGSGKEELQLSIVEGIRTGVFFLVGISAWRLTGIGRLLVVCTWMFGDIWVFKLVVVHGIGDGFITFGVGCVTGWLLMCLQGRMDRFLSEMSSEKDST